ncbi:DUF4132 domain-containing protein [Streptomyces sp. NPDC048604]|uniref:DUF4132 domain-containing protein n=1 Tax=Streptomyces sp. NPDC048604 TaxID=3365578 RepID=UPI003714277B
MSDVNDFAVASEEAAVLAGLPEDEQALFAAMHPSDTYSPPDGYAERWRRISGIPAYATYARRALEAAAERVGAIGRGELPYAAEKAFTADEVAALGRAARTALFRDEPWLPALLDGLLPGVAVAPTAARTLPSQALLFELVRAGRDFPTPELVTAVRAARAATRHAGVPKQLEKNLKKVEANLVERVEVALRQPTLGFGPDGVLRRELGPYEAVVTAGAGGATLTWSKDGQALRSVPAPARRDHPAAVKELRDLVKRVDIQHRTLARALEAGWTADMIPPYRRWRAELAEHPVARAVVRRLVWEIETAPGRWQAVLPEFDALPDAPEDAAVRLWHPLRSDPRTVESWRDLLTERQLRQPFKQAFREIYRLTPAEEETRDHSDRFAGHLVHYRRMFALFRARSWTSRLLGPWDSGYDDAASRTLAAGEWEVGFHHVLADWSEEDVIASTDQVRFRRRTSGGMRPAPLTEVPPLVLSEAMRDVDLFVGVTSIAADPDWQEGGRRPYWEQAGFGELNGTATTRRDALARILPRLKIADRCALEERCLVVRGELSTYKIHLGSANIRMTPDDAYLCVVPAPRKSDGTVFLPFEDDRLSLILSKAFLLADDASITDDSILNQIKRHSS